MGKRDVWNEEQKFQRNTNTGTLSAECTKRSRKKTQHQTFLGKSHLNQTILSANGWKGNPFNDRTCFFDTMKFKFNDRVSKPITSTVPNLWLGRLVCVFLFLLLQWSTFCQWTTEATYGCDCAHASSRVSKPLIIPRFPASSRTLLEKWRPSVCLHPNE